MNVPAAYSTKLNFPALSLEMASDTIRFCRIGGGATAESLSFRRSLLNLRHLSFNLKTINPPPLRLRGACRASNKRNPKRLKYSTPQFTKDGKGLLRVEVDPSGTDSWKLEPIVNMLKQGCVGVIPTDTVYSIVCHLNNPTAIERLRRIKGIDPSKPLSILCRSFRDIDIYTLGFPRGNGQGQASIFRLIKRCLPGPYTFILPATKALPKQCLRYGSGTQTAKYVSRKNVGVRLPDDAICQAILEKMDSPLISTSVKCPKEDEWMMDPVVIADVYGPEGLDFVVDGGVRVADPSTVVDMTVDPPRVVRQGKGPVLDFMLLEGDENSGTEEILTAAG